MPSFVFLTIVGVIAFANAARRKKRKRNDGGFPENRNDEEWGRENDHSSDGSHGHDGDGE